MMDVDEQKVRALLRRGPARFSTLVAALRSTAGVSEDQARVSRVLQRLRRCGAVRSERRVWYLTEVRGCAACEARGWRARSDGTQSLCVKCGGTGWVKDQKS